MAGSFMFGHKPSLLELPAEIRMKIWSYAVARGRLQLSIHRPITPLHLAIVHICRDIRKEAATLLAKSEELVWKDEYDGFDRFPPFLKKIYLPTTKVLTVQIDSIFGSWLKTYDVKTMVAKMPSLQCLRLLDDATNRTDRALCWKENETLDDLLCGNHDQELFKESLRRMTAVFYGSLKYGSMRAETLAFLSRCKIRNVHFPENLRVEVGIVYETFISERKVIEYYIIYDLDTKLIVAREIYGVVENRRTIDLATPSQIKRFIFSSACHDEGRE